MVLEGSAYAISAATFPTYFLKDLSEASETQMRLDLDLFGRWIAPALNATVRFVGSEPSDPLTNRYNRLMLEVLPLDVVEIPRLNAVSASAVRASLAQGRLSAASALCPASSRPYLVAALADRALRMELDTPCKPGLVGPDGNGALIHLTEKEGRFPTGYSQLIYGSDNGFTESSPANYLWDRYETVLKPHQITAPVFGIAHTDEQTGYLAVVEQGEYQATLNAAVAGQLTGYNNAYFTVTYISMESNTLMAGSSSSPPRSLPG